MLVPQGVVDERQRRLFYSIIGAIFFMFVFLFLSQGRGPRQRPEDLDLSFDLEDDEKTLTFHFFKSPTDEVANNREARLHETRRLNRIA